MTTTVTKNRQHSLTDPEFLSCVNQLRQTDNWTNGYYLAREYLFLALVIGVTIFLYESFWDGAESLLWAIPLTLLANLCVGAGQHRLATFGHEAAHFMLFKNRLLNEIASEWFCMFPILATTHRYRHQHLGHHQHTNDPELDPDVMQLTLSGHRFRFPMTLGQFLWQCIFMQLFWLPNLLRYVFVRATFHFDHGSPALQMKRPAARALKLAGTMYYVTLLASLIYGIWAGDNLVLYAVPVVLLAVMLAVLACVPATWFPDYALKCDLPERWRSLLQVTFHTMVVTGLAWLTQSTSQPWWLYYFLLWLGPAGTSFAFYLMLGQIAQHGNADQGRLTNTRVFFVHPLIRLSVFPIGNDYHVPHHMFMNVPHYNLPKLHALLMQTPEYRRRVTIVTGCFFHDSRRPKSPTVVDLMTNAKPLQ